MKYPNGSRIRIGDLIWYNGGSCIGYVQEIAETEDQFVSWGLHSPHIFVSNEQPFDPSVRIGVAYSEVYIAEDGIGPLTAVELSQFSMAATRALGVVPSDVDYSTYSMISNIENCQSQELIFIFSKGGTELFRTSVPIEFLCDALQ